LGGKAAYPKLKVGFEAAHEARLFHCSNATGFFDVSEIVDFAQDDLSIDDVFMLDCYTTLFIWIGEGSNESEKHSAAKMAEDYLNAAKSDGRGDDTSIVTVHSGKEPAMFTCRFLAWDKTFFEQSAFVDPYEAKLQKMRTEKESSGSIYGKPSQIAARGGVRAPAAAKPTPAPAPAPVSSASRNPPPAPATKVSTENKVPYEQLAQRVEGMDVSSKEVTKEVSEAPAGNACCTIL